MTKIIVSSAFLCIAVLGGCAAEAEGEATSESEAAARRRVQASEGSSLLLKYEGTCDFLRSCSAPSRRSPAGFVMWGCTGLGECNDDAMWVAAPTRASCGERVRICAGDRCVVALVKDTSVSGDWEGSTGVMAGLGLPHGLTGRCSGFGNGRVSVRRLRDDED